MESRTKPRLSDADIRRLVGAGIGVAEAEILEHNEFIDGYFNAAHGVLLTDGRELVLKVAPRPAVKVLRYEVDLMHNEIEFLDRAKHAGVPLPKVWHSDPDQGVILMERIHGISLEQAKKSMPPDQLLSVRRELGRMAAAINEIPGEFFGYPRRDGHTHSGSWRTSFSTFIKDILDDVVETDRPLPRPAFEIWALIERHLPLLSGLIKPALVHFDLWDGNVFVREEPGGWRIVGLIDGERAFYGDPIAELVSMGSFCGEAESDAVLDGYLARPLTGEERIRLSLYRIYLWLILIAETGVRCYSEEVNQELLRFAGERLTGDLAELDRQR